MKNKKSIEEKLEAKIKFKKITKYIVKYIVIFLISMAALMVLPSFEKYIIYLVCLLIGASLLTVLLHKFIDVKKLGLGKTRKELEKEINQAYFKVLGISFGIIIALLLIDFLAYHKTVNHYYAFLLYLLSLNIFTLPLNYLLNIRQKLIYKIAIIILTIVILVLAIWLYIETSYFYLGYAILVLLLIVLFIIRQRSYRKKDL